MFKSLLAIISWVLCGLDTGNTRRARGGKQLVQKTSLMEGAGPGSGTLMAWAEYYPLRPRVQLLLASFSIERMMERAQLSQTPVDTEIRYVQNNYKVKGAVTHSFPQSSIITTRLSQRGSASAGIRTKGR